MNCGILPLRSLLHAKSVWERRAGDPNPTETTNMELSLDEETLISPHTRWQTSDHCSSSGQLPSVSCREGQSHLRAFVYVRECVLPSGRHVSCVIGM